MYCFLLGKYLFSDRWQFSLQQQCCLLILPAFTSPEVDDRLALVVNQLVVVFLVRVRRISRFLHQLWTSTFKRQHLQLFFYQNQKRSQTGLVLTWRVGEPLSCKRQRIRSSLSLSPQFFSDLHHKGILYLLHNEMIFDVISLQPETKLLNFQISSLLLLEHMLSRSCWKLFNLCCQQLIQLFKSGSK